MTENESLKAVEESAEAHSEATGHDRIDATVVNQFPTVVAVTCTECGQHLGNAMSDR